jgi:hypothetical protein
MAAIAPVIAEAGKIWVNEHIGTTEELNRFLTQLRHYHQWQGSFRYQEYGGMTFSVQEWWKLVCGDPEVNFLAKFALKLFTVKPHAAGPERVFSLFDWHQAKRRGHLHMAKISTATIICMFYKNKKTEEKTLLGKRKAEVLGNMTEVNLIEAEDTFYGIRR